ncbi:hypothetical protein JAAARDRAFT_56898 [Jaapia argillacea MUCL 33604]|uniref:Golgi apparatus membrane protein TVP38 n=1 Tax=Jaapia argillacea MUCL 33604 TaxID=933084 RepID=A0A067PY92_9AGAM|nr:hypothetical protein JAAARDRAFT_56898 [Jaapia argillacea MUCL 33604]
MATPYQAYRAPASNSYPPAPTYGYNGPVQQPRKNEPLARDISRTPSPTPSELKELEKSGPFDWEKWSDWRFWIRKEWLWYYVAFVIIVVLVALMTIYHTQIVHWLEPVANWMKDLKFGWLIPIGIFFIISFPPLFGHEILAVLCGLVWGLWIGFAIVAAGTFVGEIGNFYAFKYCCRARGEKLEKTEISYACLARVVRDGGFKIALIARLSAIPGHFTTAVFSTCGMGIIVFAIACILSLPKQFITVYLGVILEQSETGAVSTKTRIINYSVVAITTLITFVAMWYIYREMGLVKGDVIYARRKARQEKLGRAPMVTPYGNPSFASTTEVPFNPSSSESDLETGDSYTDPSFQKWDKNGRAIGYTGDPRLYAPQPQRAPARIPAYKTPEPRYSEEDDAAYGGMAYPMNERNPEGRLPLRQGSDEWDSSHQSSDSSSPANGQPTRRVASPPGLVLRDPFESTETLHGVPQQQSQPPLSSSPQPAPIPPPPRHQPAPLNIHRPNPASPNHSHPTSPATATPTQTQYLNYHSSINDSLGSGPLPTPTGLGGASRPQNPPPTAPQYSHALDGSDDSFYSAGGHSRNATEPSRPLKSAPPQARTFSPPPPSYRSANGPLR